MDPHRIHKDLDIWLDIWLIWIFGWFPAKSRGLTVTLRTPLYPSFHIPVLRLAQLVSSYSVDFGVSGTDLAYLAMQLLRTLQY